MTFHLFKNVYLELASAFQYHDSNDHDCILLTEQYDAVLPPEHTRLVYKYGDLDSLLADRFGGYVGEFFKALFSYSNSTGKNLVVFCKETDFSKLVLQYYADIYPGLSPNKLLALHDKVGDRIFMRSTAWAWASQSARAAYQAFGEDRSNLFLQVQNTQPQLAYSVEMKRTLPFESLYADYLIAGEKSPYFLNLLEHVRDFAIFELRNLILTVCDSILSTAHDVESFFPEVRPFYHLQETFNDSRFSILFDPKSVSSDSRTWTSEASDLKHVMEAYEPEYIEYLIQKSAELSNVSPTMAASYDAMITSWRIYSHAFKSGHYRSVLSNAYAPLIGAMSINNTYRSKHHWFLVKYVQGLLDRKDPEADKFRL